MNCKVSIIVPVYNGAEFLAETIEHILCSSYNNLEILLIDDGSSDDSLEICKKYQLMDNRIIVYHQENAGIIAARNQGLKMASGKYICFCDQDDLVEKDMYKLMLLELEKNKCSVCVCSTGKYINGEKIPYETYENNVYENDDILKQMVFPIVFDGYKVEYKIQRRVTGTIWKCMIERELIINNNIVFKRFINFEDDLLFFFDVISRCGKLVTMEYVGYYWRINSMSETYRWKYIEDLEIKQVLYQNYIQEVLKRFDVDENVIETYKKFAFYVYIADLIDNEGSPFNLKKRKMKLLYLKNNIFLEEFDEKMKDTNRVEWGFLKRKILLILVKLRLIKMAYGFNCFYRGVKKRGVRYDLWSNLEKKLRGC